MRVAITGITGFLGGSLAHTLIQRGHQVIGIVRPTSPSGHLRPLGVDLRVAPLENAAPLRAALSGADVLVHAAAKVHHLGPWRDFVTNTIQGTRAALDAAVAAGLPHFIQISTVGVYGFPPARGGAPFVETDGQGRIHRWNYYSRAKAEAETIVHAAQQTGRIAATVFRPTWIYGPRDAAILGRLTDALRQRRFRWIGDADNRLSLVYVTDAANAIALAVERDAARGQTYNICADEFSPTQAEFITRLCELLQLPLPTRRLSYRAAYALALASECATQATAGRLRLPWTRLSVLLLGGHRRFANDKLRQELGWQPQVSFAEGIVRATEWLRQPAVPVTQ
jgi:2-alkyl-3-oxoalkanoate reductase